MKASIGRTVIVIGVNSNGSDTHAAVITRVWSDRSTKDGAVGVNLTVFPDLSSPMQLGSVMLHDTQEAALAARYGTTAPVAHWPTRD